MIERKYYIRCALVLIVIALIAIECARAHTIITCTSNPCDWYSQGNVRKVPLSNEYVITAPKATGSGDYNFNPYTDTSWTLYANLASDDLVGTCTNETLGIEGCHKNLARRKDLPNPVEPPAEPFTFTGYDCKPKSSEEVRIGFEGGSGAGVWYCDTPKAIVLQYYCGQKAKIPDGYFSLAVAAVTSLLKPVRACTKEELDLVDKIHFAQGVKIRVAPIASGSRPIYAATATNTKGADTGKRATVGDACGWKRLQDAYGKPTNYFEFPGGYTLCQVSGTVTK